MALFDNISYGITPEFTSSPDVVKMDFFSDISPIGSMISSSSAVKSESKKEDSKSVPMLYNQQVLSGYERKRIDKIKNDFQDLYLKKAKKLAMENNISISKAMASLAPEIEKYASAIQDAEIEYNANVELHKRNQEYASKDYQNQKKAGQFTLLQQGNNREGFLGFDKNGNVTSDENKIVTPMTNSQYYQLTEKNIKYGDVYNSPIEIDLEKGDQFIRQAMTNAGSNYNESGSSNEGFTSQREAQAFKNYFDKSALRTVSIDSKNNRNQLLNEIDVLSRFIPLESRRALKQEYLEARTRPVSKYVDYDSKGNKTYKELKDMEFGEGFKVYLYDKIMSRYGSEFDKSYKQDVSYKLYGDDVSGSGFGGVKGVTNWWDNVAKNKMIGGATVLFNNPNASENIYIRTVQDRMKSWNNSMANAMRNSGKTEQQINEFLNSTENIQKFEAYRAKSGKSVPSFNSLNKETVQSEIQKNGFGGIFTKGQKMQKWWKEDTKDFLSGKRTFVSENEDGTPNPYVKTTFPMSEQQLNRNYGAEVIKYDVDGNEVSFGLAGTGAELTNDVYGEGMVKLSPVIKRNAVVLSTNAVYQGVDRGDNRKYNSNALAKQTVLIPKEDAEKYAKAKLYANGRFGEYSYLKDNFTESILDVRELSSDEINIALEEAKKNGNTNGATKLQKAKDNADDYVAITLYQDFQESAESLAAQQSQKKPLYEDKPNANNGNKYSEIK